MPTQPQDPAWHTFGKSPLINGDAGGTPIPKDKTHLKRFPFVFLVDVSHSTSFGGDNADLHAINRELPRCFETLRSPPPDSDLANVKGQIDICLVTYSQTPKNIFLWQPADELPTSVSLQSETNTSTRAALNHAMDLIEERLKLLKQPGQKVQTGAPHIFHITDGVPNDVYPHMPEWKQLVDRIAVFATNADQDRATDQKGHLLHFITPSAERINKDNRFIDENGNDISGKEALIKLSGEKTVITLNRGASSLPDVIKLITAIISVKSTNSKTTVAETIAEAVEESDGALGMPDSYPALGAKP